MLPDNFFALSGFMWSVRGRQNMDLFTLVEEHGRFLAKNIDAIHVGHICHPPTAGKADPNEFEPVLPSPQRYKLLEEKYKKAGFVKPTISRYTSDDHCASESDVVTTEVGDALAMVCQPGEHSD